MVPANDNIEGKICTLCGEWSPIDNFHKHPRGKLGRHSWCKPCSNGKRRGVRARSGDTPEMKRKWLLKSRYGLTPEGYDRIFSSQGGRCAICREVPARPCVDHDHDSGAVRGILCHHCNIRLPAVEDASYRRPAMEYLALHSDTQRIAA